MGIISIGLGNQCLRNLSVDFYSTRVGTYLQRNGVNSRTAMELMRHSDRKLTDKIYTDSNLLPLGEVVNLLKDR